MQIKYEPLESVVQKSRAALVVDIISVSPFQEDGYWQSIEFHATSTSKLFGDEPLGQELDCRYWQGIPHRRGDRAVFPLVTGSGLEFGLKKGDRMIVLLREPEGEDELIEVLRVEPISRARIIQEQKNSRTGRSNES